MDVEVYMGKFNMDQPLETVLGVAQLCKPFEGHSHCIFTYQFYTSVNATEYMLKKQRYMNVQYSFDQKEKTS